MLRLPQITSRHCPTGAVAPCMHDAIHSSPVSSLARKDAMASTLPSMPSMTVSPSVFFRCRCMLGNSRLATDVAVSIVVQNTATISESALKRAWCSETSSRIRGK